MMTSHKYAAHIESDSPFQLLIVVCFVAILSYLAARVGGTLVIRPEMMWPVWPGNAVLVAVLLLTKRKRWPVLLVAGLVGFTLYDLQQALPIRAIILLVVADSIEILVAALGISYMLGGAPRLNGVRALAKYSFFAVILAPISVASVAVTAFEKDSWWVAFFTEALALLTLTPAILGWGDIALTGVTKEHKLHYLEAASIFLGLMIMGYLTFVISGRERPALLYSLVPFLLWAALRFGIAGVSNSMVLVSFVSVWGAVHGHGPFTGNTPLHNVLSLQLFLLVAGSSFMVLAGLVEEHRVAEESIRESEKRFRLVADSAPVMVWMSDTNKLCTYFNTPWLNFTGRSVEQELGNGWAEGVHPDDLQGCLDTYIQAFDRRADFQMEYRLRRHDREYRWIFDVGVPRYSPEGAFAGYIGSCVDVTDRKRAEETRFRHAAVVESSEDAIITKNLDATIMSWNTGAQRLFGYTEAEAVGQPITILIPPDLLDEENKILERLRSGDRIEHYETVRITKTGRKVDVSLTICPVKDSNGRVIGFSKIAHDITERKRSEQLLQDTNRALEIQTTLLQSREALLKIFVKHVPAAVAMFDRDMRYLEVSDRWCADYSVDKTNLLGRRHYDVFPDIPEQWKEAHRRGLAGETVRADEDRWDRKGGTSWERWEIRPWQNADGLPGGILIFSEDITRRKEMEEALSDLSRKLIQSQEQERARIGRELHDDVSQRLALLALELQQLQENPSEIRERVQALHKRTGEIANDVQALSHELHASKLEYLGVIAGTKSWCKEFGEHQGIEINFKAEIASAIPFEIGVTLFRILQEALHNSVKHSGVKRVEVQLSEHPNEIHLTISDKGKGFEIEAARQGKGLGLASMEERARLVKGMITFDSKPMAGTTIRVCVPLASEPLSQRQAV